MSHLAEKYKSFCLEGFAVLFKKRVKQITGMTRVQLEYLMIG